MFQARLHYRTLSPSLIFTLAHCHRSTCIDSAYFHFHSQAPSCPHMDIHPRITSCLCPRKHPFLLSILIKSISNHPIDIVSQHRPLSSDIKLIAAHSLFPLTVEAVVGLVSLISIEVALLIRPTVHPFSVAIRLLHGDIANEGLLAAAERGHRSHRVIRGHGNALAGVHWLRYCHVPQPTLLVRMAGFAAEAVVHGACGDGLVVAGVEGFTGVYTCQWIYTWVWGLIRFGCDKGLAKCTSPYCVCQ